MIKIINPSDNSSDSENEETLDVITPTSIIGLKQEKNLLPTYSQSNDNFLQFSRSVHTDNSYLSSRNKVAPNNMMTTRVTTSKEERLQEEGLKKGEGFQEVL
ncbi:hypothetical protein Glove_187g123 [Diversispora epigaea]|uniref:Uncharacterized protein n=1 Tax=Diversispora epigaea TaxID=1348612 RepID=A0A397IM03_9GLOM|nr:hypothetical protein Glove_187g123 [Diversispora epigaea]